ncbi:MAG: type II toxin-antitoxin system mRNA interferase toxin, RelE/StbE family [Patescibacteria group bacterium]
MEIRLSEDVIKSLKKIKKSNPVLLKQIRKQLLLFKSNPQHNSLRLHKLSGNLDNMWSISINMNIRMIYIIRIDNEGSRPKHIL